jgi:hypothetical protein
MRVDSTKTCALAPGNAIKILTRGGAISGNWDIGLVKIASTPKKIMAIEIEIARTGR